MILYCILLLRTIAASHKISFVCDIPVDAYLRYDTFLCKCLFLHLMTLYYHSQVLKDPTLSVHHSTATQTIIQIFRGLGVQCVPFLELIVPYFLQVRRLGISIIVLLFVLINCNR